VDIVKTGGTIAYLSSMGKRITSILNADMKSLLVSSLVSKRTVYEIDVGDEPYWVTVMGKIRCKRIAQSEQDNNVLGYLSEEFILFRLLFHRPFRLN
jgi:hypothetical protein